MAALYEHSSLRAHDGVEIYYCRDIPVNPKAIVVMVHGLAEHCGRYDHATRTLNDAGYGVYRFDNRGHGKSGGERGFAEDFHHFLDDADVVVEKARAEYPHLPVFLFGHSMGGFIAVGYGVKYPGKLAGQIFSGAAVMPLPAFAFLEEDDYRTRGSERMPNGLSALICRCKKVIHAYENDPLVLKDITISLAGTVLVDGVAWVRDNIDKFSYPCLILHGGGDQIVPSQSSVWLHDHVPVDDKNLKIYPGLYHEILNEEEKGEVLEDMVHWLDARVK